MGGPESKPPVPSGAGCRATNWRGLDAVECFDCRRIDSAAKNCPLDPQCSLREQAGDPKQPFSVWRYLQSVQVRFSSRLVLSEPLVHPRDSFHELALAGEDSGCRGLEKSSNPELQPSGKDPVDHFSKSVGRSSFLS